jgi:NTE family protein
MAPQALGLRRIFGDVWPTRALWITAVELLSGRSVAFGRHDAPTTDVGTAVSCSGAVPSICKPVQVADRRYVDGGMASATHLDTLSDADVDVAIVSSPLSMFSPMSALMRLERKRLERRGVRVITFEPHGRARAAMGMNPMRLEKAPDVARATYASTRAWLERATTARLR